MWKLICTLALLLVAVNVSAQTYFQDDFEYPNATADEWEIILGDWEVNDGIFQQTGQGIDTWLIAMVSNDYWDMAWTEYTVEFKVRNPVEGLDNGISVLFWVQAPVPVNWDDRRGPTSHVYRRGLNISMNANGAIVGILIHAKKLLTIAKKLFTIIDLMKVFQLFALAISVIGFFYAVEYFSVRASLDISVIPDDLSERPDEVRFSTSVIREFYEKSNLDVPELFYENKNLKEVFSDSNNNQRQHIIIGAGTSDSDILTAMKRGQKIGGYIKERINLLESQMEKYRYRKHIYVWGHSEFWQKETAEDLRKYLETKLAEQDYFVFLCALISSRQLSQIVSIKNTGGMDLKNVKVVIPSPVSKITESRKNNLLKVDIQSELPNITEEDPDGVSVLLPSLKKEDFFILNITTRENQIKESDILRSYDKDRVVDKQKIVCWAVKVFLGMCSLICIHRLIIFVINRK